jgi:hypothetical protein
MQSPFEFCVLCAGLIVECVLVSNQSDPFQTALGGDDAAIFLVLSDILPELKQPN